MVFKKKFMWLKILSLRPDYPLPFFTALPLFTETRQREKKATTRFLFYKHKVQKHTQPQIREV